MYNNYHQYQKSKLHDGITPVSNSSTANISSSSVKVYTETDVMLIILKQELHHKDELIKQKLKEKHSLQELHSAKETCNVLKQQYFELQMHHYEVQASKNRLDNLLNMHDKYI